MCCWIALALIRSEGVLRIVALVLIASELIEPLNVAVTPLAFLALGASLHRSSNLTNPSVFKWHGPVAAVFAFFAMVPAIWLVVGDAAYSRGTNQYLVAQDSAALSSASTANTLLRPWPEPASLLAQIWYIAVLNRRSDAQQENIRWASMAAHRDPSDPDLWVALANYQLDAGNLETATISAEQGVKYGPYVSAADDVEAVVDYLSHRISLADVWWRRSLIGNPMQPLVHDELRGECLPESMHRSFVERKCITVGLGSN
jgi:hypothetical protein